MWVCPYCRVQNTDTARFCLKCRREPPRTVPAPQQKPTQARPAAAAAPTARGLPPQVSFVSSATGEKVGNVEWALRMGGKPAQAAPAVPQAAHAARPVAPAAPQKAPEPVPASYEELVRAGKAAVDASQFERAVDFLGRALQMSPGDRDVWMARGTALRCLRRGEEALHCYDRAIALKPDAPDGWRRKAFVLRIMNRPLDAIACYDKLIALNPKDTAAMNDKANALDDMRRYSEAVQLYDMVLKISPKDKFALENKEADEKLIRRIQLQQRAGQ